MNNFLIVNENTYKKSFNCKILNLSGNFFSVKRKYLSAFSPSDGDKSGYRPLNILKKLFDILFPTLQFYTLNYGYDT